MVIFGGGEIGGLFWWPARFPALHDSHSPLLLPFQLNPSWICVAALQIFLATIQLGPFADLRNCAKGSALSLTPNALPSSSFLPKGFSRKIIMQQNSILILVIIYPLELSRFYFILTQIPRNFTFPLLQRLKSILPTPNNDSLFLSTF